MSSQILSVVWRTPSMKTLGNIYWCPILKMSRPLWMKFKGRVVRKKFRDIWVAITMQGLIDVKMRIFYKKLLLSILPSDPLHHLIEISSPSYLCSWGIRSFWGSFETLIPLVLGLPRQWRTKWHLVVVALNGSSLLLGVEGFFRSK